MTMDARLLPTVCCPFLIACVTEAPIANDPSMVAPAASTLTPATAIPPPPCPSEPAKQEFDSVLKGRVASEHRHCSYLVEAEVSSSTGGVYDHIVRPTPDEVLFEVCAPDRPTGDKSCALVLAPTTSAGAVPDIKKGDKLWIIGTTMEVKGLWVLDAKRIEKAK